MFNKNIPSGSVIVILVTALLTPALLRATKLQLYEVNGRSPSTIAGDVVSRRGNEGANRLVSLSVHVSLYPVMIPYCRNGSGGDQLIVNSCVSIDVIEKLNGGPPGAILMKLLKLKT